jgi:hypothetical protein
VHALSTEDYLGTNFFSENPVHAKFAELAFHGLRRRRRELHTSGGRKRKVRMSEPSQAFDTPLTMPLKNPRFLCQSRPRHPQLLKAALNALEADELTVHRPGA